MRMQSFCVVALGVVLLISAQGRGAEPVKILEVYKGVVGNDEKLDLKAGYIATAAEWKAVWEKVNPKEKLPEVDFAKQMILVTWTDAGDPNTRNTSAQIDENGAVKISTISTKIGYKKTERTKFEFHLISNMGVKSVGGNPLPK